MMRCTRMLPYLVVAAAVGAVFAIAGVPLGTILPFAVVLVCPLMMFVMMRAMTSSPGASSSQPVRSEDGAHVRSHE